MKSKLEFDLSDPEQEREHRNCLQGTKVRVILETLDMHLRGELKHSKLSKQTYDKLDAVRALLWQELHDEGIDLYE